MKSRVRKVYTPKFIPAYQKAGYGYYDEYLKSEEWARTKRRFFKAFPKGHYCFICDSTKNLNLHHENYKNIPKEDIHSDLVVLCQTCHRLVHLTGTSKTPLLRVALRSRRLELRRKYVQSIRPTTFWHFLGRLAYRFLW